MGKSSHTIAGNTVLIDSRKAPSKLITGSTGVTKVADIVVRHQCPDGYSTLTDNIAMGFYQSDGHMCVADHCLTKCTRIPTAYDYLFLIGNGYSELGNSGSLEYGSFFRNLSITDDTPVDELFKCLTYECLSFY